MNDFLQFAFLFAVVPLVVMALISYFNAIPEKELRKINEEQARAKEQTRALEQAELDLKVSSLALSNTLTLAAAEDQEKEQELGQLLNKPTTIR